MRIRKNAAKILSSLLGPTQPFAAAAAAASSVVGRELELLVCQLNQSPWDVMDFAAPATTMEFRDYYQELEERHVEKKAWIGRVDEEEAAAAAASAVNGVQSTGSTRHRAIVEEIAGVEATSEDKATTRIETTTTTNRKKRRKKGKNYVDCCDKTKGWASAKSTSSRWAAAGVDEDVEVDDDAGNALIPTCEKIGGVEGQHCRREASGHQALGKYHRLGACYSNGDREAQRRRRRRRQVQSFNMTEEGDSGAKNTSALLRNKGRKTKIGTLKKGCCGRGGDESAKAGVTGGAAANGRRKGRSKPTPSDFYYYYSGFDPFWGKRSRGGGGGGAGWPGTGTAAADQSDSDAAASPMVHDQATEDLDEDDEDMDAGVDGPAGTGDGRRGRKPVKARSLKSLM